MVSSRVLAGLVLPLLALTGCGGNAGASSAPGGPETVAVRTDLSLTPAKGASVVKLTGHVNAGKAIAVDMAGLDALPQRTVTTYEPFLKKDMTFSGVWFADLLSAANADGHRVTVHALDDYEKTFDVDVLREKGVLLATRAGGERIRISAGGPVRLVFPRGSKAGADPDLWVWSVDRITVG